MPFWYLLAFNVLKRVIFTTMTSQDPNCTFGTMHLEIDILNLQFTIKYVLIKMHVYSEKLGLGVSL